MNAYSITTALGGCWHGHYGLAFCPGHQNTRTPALSLSDGDKLNPLTGPSHRESDDNYARVVAHLGDSWRVIVCRDDLQWILQRRDGERAGRARWTGVGYCLTPEALLRLCRASGGLVDPSAWSVLDELPAHIGEMPQ